MIILQSRFPWRSFWQELRVTFRRLNDMKSDMVQSSVFQNGDLKNRLCGRLRFMKNTELHLTPIEYKLLCLLSQNVGKVLTHTYIQRKIWEAHGIMTWRPFGCSWQH